MASLLLVDVYTCGKGRPEYIVDQFKKLLKPTRSHQTFLERGAQHVVREQSHNTLSETSQESGIPAELQNATVIESDSALSEVLNTTNICVNADDDEDDCYLLRNAEVLVDERSQYQRIEVVDTQNWGRCMLLDRVVQFCESDNAIYTREMVNKAMSSLENPAGPLNITIVGGGDGWIASYLLDHYESRIHQIQIVDIDQKVAEITQKYFRPEGVHDSFTDSRVHWTFADAGKWLREHPTAASTSLVIIDCTDHTIESSKVLYTTQFYQDVHSLLTPGGYVVQQMNTEVEEYSEFFDTLAKDWKLIGLNGLRQWSEYVPSFGGKSLFWLAQKK
ncbi:S-adenosyl-L-methionine-dependent methyltransferase [Paraphysoderma sedebokerense]|nr:S-adenosyl-L-methionine-dependent methyltransferase [Paraphysoderma sedebokerense]